MGGESKKKLLPQQPRARLQLQSGQQKRTVPLMGRCVSGCVDVKQSLDETHLKLNTVSDYWL